jgi:hypothetical protein
LTSHDPLAEYGAAWERSFLLALPASYRMRELYPARWFRIHSLPETAAEQLALIQRERAANGQPAYASTTDATSVLTELTEQRSREFLLDGKRPGDPRRHPSEVLNIPAAGSAYFNPGFAPIGTSTCDPLPVQEVDNNPPPAHRSPRTPRHPAP